MSKFCANCGTSLKDTDRFCQKCGTPVQVMNQEMSVNNMDVVNQEIPENNMDVVNQEMPVNNMETANQEAGISLEKDTDANMSMAYTNDNNMAAGNIPANNIDMGNIPFNNPVNAQMDNTMSNMNVQQPVVNPADSKKNKKILVAIIAVLVLFVVGTLGVKAIKYFTGYQPTLNKMCKGLEDFDMDTLESLASDLSNKYYKYRWGVNHDYLADYKEKVSDKLDYYEENVGAIKSISYEITDENEYSKRKIKEVQEKFADYTDVKFETIEKIVLVDLRLEVEGKNDTETFYISDLILIKEKSGWKIFYGSL